MAEIALTNFYPPIPRDGSFVKGKVLRDQLKALGTDNAGPDTPGVPAILIGDRRFSTVSLTPGYEVVITIDGETRTIDLRDAANAPPLATLNEVVSAINLAFDDAGFGQDVAYSYSVNSGGSGYVALVSPTDGPASTITINRGSGTTDALDKVFGISGRGTGVPLTVTGESLPIGYRHFRTDTADDDGVRWYVGAPAQVVGTRNLANGVNLATRQYLRIRVTGSFGSIYKDVYVAGASPANTTAAEIRDKINTAFVADGSWPAASPGPATLVPRNGTGQYLKIVSGPSSAPTVGASAEVKISEFISLVALKDDAVEDILGLPRGESGRRIQRIPHTFRGASFASSGMRGVNHRSGPGLGPWGKVLERREEIPSQGVVDGEVRFDKTSGVPWIFREGAGVLPGVLGEAAGWRRAVPAYEYPVSYDRVMERYRIVTTSDQNRGGVVNLGYRPEPFLNSDSPNLSRRHVICGAASDVPTLVDGRSSMWPRTSYPGDLLGGSDLIRFTAAPRLDEFNNGTSFVAFGSNKLGSTNEGSAWVQTASHFFTVGGVGAVYVGASSPGTEDRAYLGAPVGYRYDDTPITATTIVSNAVYSFFITGETAPDLPSSGGIKAFYVVCVDKNNHEVIRTSGGLPIQAWADNASPTANLVGNAISGKVNVATGGTANQGIPGYGTGVIGEVQLNLASSPANSTFLCFYTLANDLVVCAELSKSGEARQGGNVAKAGLIYAASSPTSGGPSHSTGYAVLVQDDGQGGLYELTGTSTMVLRQYLQFDPPLDTTPRTLRIVYQPGIGHYVFWNGSPLRDNWFYKELHTNPTGKLSTAQTAGGLETDPVINPFVGSNVDPAYNEIGHYVGILGAGVAASGSYGAKDVVIANFQAHGGSAEGVAAATPALPPISAIRTRDSIHSIRLKDKDGVVQAGVITDTNHAKPMVIQTLGDLAGTIDPVSRLLALDVDILAKDQLWHPTNNPNARFAFWRPTSAINSIGVNTSCSNNGLIDIGLMAGYATVATGSPPTYGSILNYWPSATGSPPHTAEPVAASPATGHGAIPNDITNWRHFFFQTPRGIDINWTRGSNAFLTQNNWWIADPTILAPVAGQDYLRFNLNIYSSYMEKVQYLHLVIVSIRIN